MKIVSIAISKKKGTRKEQIKEVEILKDHGLKGDAHAGKWHRQVSFLSSENDWKDTPFLRRIRTKGRSNFITAPNSGFRCSLFIIMLDYLLKKRCIFEFNIWDYIPK